MSTIKNSISEYGEIISWLRRYQNSLWQEECLTDEILRCTSRAMKVTASLSLAPGSSGTNQAILSAIESAEVAENKLLKQSLITMRVRREIEEAFTFLPEENQKRVLYHLYIDGINQKKTAEKLNYSRKQVSRLHIAALDNLQKMSPNVPPCPLKM